MHIFTIPALILQHMPLQFIKTPNSWLLQNYILFPYFLYYKKFTQQYEYENHCKSLYFFCLLKTLIEIQKKKTMIVEMKSKQQNYICGISKT